MNANAAIHTQTHISDFALTEQEIKLLKICIRDSMIHYEQQLGDIMNNEEIDPEYKEGIIEGSQQIISHLSNILRKIS